MRRLSLMAGLSQSYVGQIARGHVTPAVAPDKLTKLAEACGVSPNWLVLGQGDPVQGNATVDPYPSRPPVLLLLEAQGVPAEVLGAIRSRYHSDGDPGTAAWFALAKEYLQGIAEIQRIRAENPPISTEELSLFATADVNLGDGQS